MVCRVATLKGMHSIENRRHQLLLSARANKVYEYLGTRRPILAVVDEDGETAQMLRMVGGHQLVSVNDAEPISTPFLVCWPMVGEGRWETVPDWSTGPRRRRCAALVEAIGDHDAG